jgi:hypothetical protein
MTLQIAFATSNLGSLNCTHLGNPALCWLELPDSTNLIAGITWNTDVVVALQDKLDITDLKSFRATSLGAFASSRDDLVDKLISDR